MNIEIVNSAIKVIDGVRKNKLRATLAIASIGSLLTPVLPVRAAELIREYSQCGGPGYDYATTLWVTEYQENGEQKFDALSLGKLNNQCGNTDRVRNPNWGDIIVKTGNERGQYDYGGVGYTGGVEEASSYVVEDLGNDEKEQLIVVKEEAYPAILSVRFRISQEEAIGVYIGTKRIGVVNRFGKVIPWRDVQYTIDYESKEQLEARPKL